MHIILAGNFGGHMIYDHMTTQAKKKLQSTRFEYVYSVLFTLSDFFNSMFSWLILNSRSRESGNTSYAWQTYHLVKQTFKINFLNFAQKLQTKKEPLDCQSERLKRESLASSTMSSVKWRFKGRITFLPASHKR